MTATPELLVTADCPSTMTFDWVVSSNDIIATVTPAYGAPFESVTVTVLVTFSAEPAESAGMKNTAIKPRVESAEITRDLRIKYPLMLK